MPSYIEFRNNTYPLCIKPSEAQQEGLNRFEEITWRVCPDEKRFLLTRLKEVATYLELEGFSESKITEFYLHPKGEETAYHALELVRQGKISSFQFATILLHWITAQTDLIQKKPCFLPLFLKDGSPNPQAKNFIGKELQGTAIDIEDFLKEAKKLPTSEQYIKMQERELMSTTTIAHVIRELGITTFNPAAPKLRSPRGNPFAVIPSFSLLQLTLKMQYPDCVQLFPVIGCSSDDELLDTSENNAHVMALRFPHIFLPAEADSADAAEDLFTVHDYYHANKASRLSSSFRQFLCSLARICTPLPQMREPFINKDNGGYVWNYIKAALYSGRNPEERIASDLIVSFLNNELIKNVPEDYSQLLNALKTDIAYNEKILATEIPTKLIEKISGSPFRSNSADFLLNAHLEMQTISLHINKLQQSENPQAQQVALLLEADLKTDPYLYIFFRCVIQRISD